jgi:hypothetical protein
MRRRAGWDSDDEESGVENEFETSDKHQQTLQPSPIPQVKADDQPTSVGNPDSAGGESSKQPVLQTTPQPNPTSSQQQVLSDSVDLSGLQNLQKNWSSHQIQQITDGFPGRFQESELKQCLDQWWDNIKKWFVENKIDMNNYPIKPFTYIAKTFQ